MSTVRVGILHLKIYHRGKYTLVAKYGVMHQ